MQDAPIRVYADTSVFGGVFDEEFARASTVFFDGIRSGRLLLVTSAIVEDELVGAPTKVRQYFEQLLPPPPTPFMLPLLPWASARCLSVGIVAILCTFGRYRCIMQ